MSTFRVLRKTLKKLLVSKNTETLSGIETRSSRNTARLPTIPKTLKPFQGLKQNSYSILLLPNRSSKNAETLSGIETARSVVINNTIKKKAMKLIKPLIAATIAILSATPPAIATQHSAIEGFVDNANKINRVYDTITEVSYMSPSRFCEHIVIHGPIAAEYYNDFATSADQIYFYALSLEDKEAMVSMYKTTNRQAKQILEFRIKCDNAGYR